MPSKQLNVVFTRPLQSFGALSPDLASLIGAVNKNIRLRDVSRLVDAELKGDASAQKELDGILAEAESMYGFPPPPNLLRSEEHTSELQSQR